MVTVLLPVVFGIGDKLGVNAFELTIPVVLAASCAFMMPISTPPNAVVYSSGQIKINQMIRVGFVLNIATILLLSTVIYWLVNFVFGG